MSVSLNLLQTTQGNFPIAGILIPGVVLCISFLLTWLLYRHFSKH